MEIGNKRIRISYNDNNFNQILSLLPTPEVERKIEE